MHKQVDMVPAADVVRRFANTQAAIVARVNAIHASIGTPEIQAATRPAFNRLLADLADIDADSLVKLLGAKGVRHNCD